MPHTKSGCMAAIFTLSKLLIESLANVGIHVWIPTIKVSDIDPKGHLLILQLKKNQQASILP